MALIVCPECGREISDRVSSCPHCGYPISNPENSSNTEPPKAQPVEVTAINIGSPKKRKTIFIVVGVIILAVIVGVVAYFTYQAQQKAKAEAEAILAHDLYIDNLELARATMLIGGIQAERLASLTHDVWYNTIYEESDSKTDKYTHSSKYVYYDDFNDALNSLYSDSSTKSSIENIQASADLVKDIMRELQSPTEDFKECYATVNEMYTAFNGLVTLAVSPSGSLASYTEAYRTYDTDFMSWYDKLGLQIPEKINQDAPVASTTPEI